VRKSRYTDEQMVKILRETDRSPMAAQCNFPKNPGDQYDRDATAANGGNLRFLYAHRQSSTDRRADPGSRIWQHVALWAQANLGLNDDGPTYKQGGYVIPKEWDPSRTAK